MTTSEYLQCYKDYDENLRQIQEYNARLIDEYPFLLPTDKSDYDYSYTLMDYMPAGWRICFGDSLLKELKEELESENLLDTYKVLEVKEKFGILCWYDNVNTKKWYEEILPKYEELSKVTCIVCGKPATQFNPFCDECFE